MKTDVRKKIEKEWTERPFSYCGQFPRLKAMYVCSGYFGEDEDCDFEELLFAVPESWFFETCLRQFEYLKTEADVQRWFENAYTSDESHILFELAMRENQIVKLEFY